MISAISGYSYISQQNNKNIAFAGLTERMSKKVYNGFYDMGVLFPKDTMKSPIVGKIPNFMFEKIKLKTNNLEQAIREVMATFAEVSNELRDFEPSAMSTMEEITKRRNNSTVKKLEDCLLKYDIVKPWDGFNISYIDKGGKGSVYKLDGLRYIHGATEDEFVMKVFHSKAIQANAYHGCFPEINAAAYWMKHLGYETNRGKFYWADVKEAYMINKFIDEDVRLPKTTPIPYDYGMKFTDEDAVHIHNVCKGYSYDWGGGVVINQSLNSNKFARRILNYIKSRKENEKMVDWYRLYHQKAVGNADSVIAGLALSIRVLPENYRMSCFKDCFEKPGKYTDRALGYTLKYLPPDQALKYYEIFAQDTKDNVLKEILANEIPLLSLKDEYLANVKDDLIVQGLAFQDYKKSYIDNSRYDEYMRIASKYQLPIKIN